MQSAEEHELPGVIVSTPSAADSPGTVGTYGHFAVLPGNIAEHGPNTSEHA